MNWKIILAGAVGGITPVVINIVTADVSYLASLTQVEMIGYLVRSIGLVFLAMVAVAMQSDKLDVHRAIQVGLAGPALITAIIQGQNAQPVKTVQSVTEPSAWVYVLPAEAYAAPTSHVTYAAPATRAVAPPAPESAFGEFLRGFTGQRSKRAE